MHPENKNHVLIRDCLLVFLPYGVALGVIDVSQGPEAYFCRQDVDG